LRKKRMLIGLMALALLMGGCAKKETDKNTRVTPLPGVVEAPEIGAEGKLADAARKRMEIYEAQLNKIALQFPGNLSYTIPGDLIAKMAKDAQELGAEPENGWYRFTWKSTSSHTYQMDALEVAEALEDQETEESDAAALPDNQKMGDFSAAGGGVYDRTYQYEAAADLSQGSAEITDILNGEITGHELFSFYVQGDTLYFADAALELTPDMDLLLSTGSYLVAVGKLEKDRVEIVEYMVENESQIPSAASMNWEQLIKFVTPVAHLTAQGDQVSTDP